MTEVREFGRTRLFVALAGIVALCAPVVAAGFAGPLLPGPMATQVTATGSQPFATLEAARGRVTVIRLGRTEATAAPMALQLDATSARPAALSVAPTTAANGTIVIPTRTNHIPDGKYTIVVRVLAKNNNVYSTATYEEVSYKAPSIFQRIGVALIAAPIFLAGILLVIAVVIGFLMYNSTRQKSLSGTPVLQGRLGGMIDKRGKLAGPVLPVADEEPIPSRSRPPVSQSAATQVSSAPIPSKPISADATMIAGDAELDGRAKTVIASAPLIATGKLTVVQAGGKVTPSEVVTLKNLPFVIGRTEGSLTIADQNVSRKHVQITYDGMTNVFYLTDLNSSNGTRLNNERITPGQPVKLTSGASIGLGPGVILRFEIL